MITGRWFTDDQIRKHIEYDYKRTGYILVPYDSLGVEKYINNNPDSVEIIIENAHPAGFFDVVQSIIDEVIVIPNNLFTIENR